MELQGLPKKLEHLLAMFQVLGCDYVVELLMQLAVETVVAVRKEVLGLLAVVQEEQDSHGQDIHDKRQLREVRNF